MEKDEKVKMTIDDLAVMVAKGFEGVEEKMATKQDVLSLQMDINSLRNDLKGFKKDTNESIAKTEEDVADLLDTDMLHDKRIEKLEKKFV